MAGKVLNLGELQTSLNLAQGSALASIGLTIPAVAIVSKLTGLNVSLGIDAISTLLLLLLSLFTIMLSFGTVRTYMLQGAVLPVHFAVYLFTIIFP